MNESFSEQEKKIILSLQNLRKTEVDFVFLQTLKLRLIQEMEKAEIVKEKVFFPRLLRFSFSLIGALALILTTATGVSWASQKSLPNDFLYPVKIATEKTKLALAPNKIERARLRVEFSEKRIQETEALGKKPNPDSKATAETLARFEREVSNLEAEITQADNLGGDKELELLYDIEKKLSLELSALNELTEKVNSQEESKDIADALLRAHGTASLGFERTGDKIFELQRKLGKANGGSELAKARLSRALGKMEVRLEGLEVKSAKKYSDLLERLREKEPTIALESPEVSLSSQDQEIETSLKGIRKSIEGLKLQVNQKEKYLETLSKIDSLEEELARVEAELEE
ncbi:MAG: hypothetical protein HYW80_01630 [Parcubacteria group bacterium]|nr:hypothetical protein [Parcubacteria group bacterium]